MHHINQRKEHRFTRATSDDVSDKDDDYDSGVSMIWILKICTALNKEKGISFIQESSDDEDDKDDKDDEYDSGFFHDRDAQNLRHIKQRKGRHIIYAMSVDQDDKDDDMIFSYCQFLYRFVSLS